VDEVNESVITYQGSIYEATDGSLVGQGGTQTLTFQAANSGESTIHLKYWRSWEGDSSVVERFDVTVTVSSD
jgi:predicted secreted protein